MKRIYISLLLIGVFLVAFGQDKEDSFTIYLVRHAEKLIDINNLKDPPLTQCGEERSKSLALFFTNIEIDRIYSTDYIRTKNTALPTAKAKNLEIEIFDASKLEEFLALIMERGEDVLIVGHSTTTPVLAGLLIGEEMGAIDERIYNRIYQVVRCNNKGKLNIFHTSYKCNN
ncbi:MAG: phosphoglycerate mutase family protein [Bacteroidales bacterium]|nr:phosphoglycerate mutase family protein [Bacteroidales bacterium]